MNPYEEEEKQRKNEDNLLRVTDEVLRTRPNRAGTRYWEAVKKLPVRNLVIGGLLICACLIGLALSERISGIGADVDRLKTQLKGQVTDLESKLVQSARENEHLRSELTQVKTELEAIKADNQRRAAQQARAAAAKKAVAKKVVAKKLSPPPAVKKQKRKP